MLTNERIYYMTAVIGIAQTALLFPACRKAM